MSKLSTTKGKTFERKIATLFRERWPDAVVRRASQADRAHQSDVYVTGGPPILARLWLECQDARSPTPLAKLDQAEGDIGYAHNPHWRSVHIPIVIWHKLGAREIYATTRMWMLDVIRGIRHVDHDVVVTMTLPELLDFISQEVRVANARADRETAKEAA